MKLVAAGLALLLIVASGDGIAQGVAGEGPAPTALDLYIGLAQAGGTNSQTYYYDDNGTPRVVEISYLPSIKSVQMVIQNMARREDSIVSTIKLNSDGTVSASDGNPGTLLPDGVVRFVVSKKYANDTGISPEGRPFFRISKQKSGAYTPYSTSVLTPITIDEVEALQEQRRVAERERRQRNSETLAAINGILSAELQDATQRADASSAALQGTLQRLQRRVDAPVQQRANGSLTSPGSRSLGNGLSGSVNGASVPPLPRPDMRSVPSTSAVGTGPRYNAQPVVPEPTTSNRNPSPRAHQASVDTDANRCISSPELRENDTTKGNTAAYVVNGCPQTIDVRICLKRSGQWNCGVRYGLPPQQRWSWSTYEYSGGVFVDARSSNSHKPLGSP